MFIALNVVGLVLLVAAMVLTVTSMVTANSNTALSRKTDVWSRPAFALGILAILSSILIDR